MMKSTIYNLYKAFKSKRARVLLLCLVHMFSLSAQTPRQDSGAKGLSTAQPLMIGFRVPEEFWSHEFMIFENNKYVKRTLAEYRGKPLILDFWATWCTSCVANFPKLDQLKRLHGDKINFLLVNSFDKDTTKIATVFRGKKTEKYRTQTPSVVLDTFLKQIFPHKAVPIYIWLDHFGKLGALSTSDFLNDNQVKVLLARMKGAQE
ncbi:TlpA family protein disulfide reductase [Sphingobacterium multivorum]|uniref:TlpA family protein disulfide reductase n=1 Tax=Sphingobacterium multivorum TaxID=28454 RepID=UPI0028ADE3E5|nr:redoxin family protein [Sphingobacterium multivorum]